jgi:hypothetical protein
MLDVYVLHSKNDELRKYAFFWLFWEQIVTFSISTFKAHSFVMYSCSGHNMFHIKNVTKMAVYIKTLDNNKVIQNRLDNYLIILKNGHLMHIDPKLYIKCRLDNYLI